MSVQDTVERDDKTALDPETWVDQYGDYLFRYAYSRLRESNAAEEVVQETFLAGVRSAEQFSGTGSEQGWLLGILKRKIIDHVRQRMKHATSSFDDEVDPSGYLFDAAGNWFDRAIAWSPPPGQKIEMEELWGVVRRCLSELPSGQADVFTLSVMEDMDAGDICRDLGITESNLWVRLHRARLGLAKCVGARWNHDRETTNVG
jgi:RNA polymerase sigma-70 factor (TIGR02943 family)